MSTKDLDSYYPDYEDYEDRAKVPFEDYLKLEEQIKAYKKAVNDLREILIEMNEYEALEKIELSKTILEDLKEELC